MKWEILIIILAVLVLVWNPQFTYDPDLAIESDFVLNAVAEDGDDFFTRLANELGQTKNPWAKGDSFLVLARLENNTDYYKSACDYFKKYSPRTSEEKAILYETLASLDCRGTRIHDLRQAAYYWKKVGVMWRADLLENLASGKNLTLEFETSEITPKLDLSDASAITIGKTLITIKDNDKVITQVDRVYRDWLGVQLYQSPFKGEILKVFSERLKYSEQELQEAVGWHEGGRLRDLMKGVDITHIPAAGTLVAKKENKWYASDDKGIFRFEVPKDKISYPTTRFLTKELAVIIDSHGMNTLVEQAIRKNADVAIACCDHPGKIKAAAYLSEHGISAICFTDLDLYRALGHDIKTVGSAPFEMIDGNMVYGSRPVSILRGQTVVVSDADIGKTLAIWYYAAPAKYFTEINKTFPLDLHIAAVDDFNQTERVFDKAKEVNANIVGTRIYSADDYVQAKDWLMRDSSRRLVLFHSLSYPYGLLISQEFRSQVSFGDVNIQGKKPQQ